MGAANTGDVPLTGTKVRTPKYTPKADYNGNTANYHVTISGQTSLLYILLFSFLLFAHGKIRTCFTYMYLVIRRWFNDQSLRKTQPVQNQFYDV